jgi:hemoglobin-like flavoprotein
MNLHPTFKYVESEYGVNNFTYAQISIVLDSWDQARFSSKDFDREFGTVVLERFFVLQPRAKKIFGYDKSEEEGDSHVAVHVNVFAGVFDSVFQMLGPDVELFEEILGQVGHRHKAAGVNPSFFPFMGQALFFALEKFLDKELTDEQREAWNVVYEGVSNVIVRRILFP